MPIITPLNKSVCLHDDKHGKWHNGEGYIAICNMALPHLLNCIALLDSTLYYHPLSRIDRLTAEDQLLMLQTELKRRGRNTK